MIPSPTDAGTLIAALIHARLQRRTSSAPLVAGICGSQGSGKSTLCQRLASQFTAAGQRVATLSLDDLYLTYAERAELARRVHPLLATRGVPGTHDVALGLCTLQALAGTGRVQLPRFDKSRDDRSVAAIVDAPVDLILFEGWCVGARAQDPHALAAPVNELEAVEDADRHWRTYVNDALAGEYQQLFASIDLLVLLAAPGFDVVPKWRTQQEQELRARTPGASVMNDAALARFVQHYERLTRHILQEMPARADLVIRLDEQRRVQGAGGL